MRTILGSGARAKIESSSAVLPRRYPTHTMERLTAKTLAFLSEPHADDHVTDAGDTVIMPRRIWERWIGAYPDSGVMLADVRNDANGIERVVCLGMPHSEDDVTVFIPQWILENIGCDLTGESEVIVEPHLEEIPIGESIVLRPMDTAIYHTDIRDAFEAGLEKYHVLQQGSMLSVVIEALGGYKVDAYIEKTEPAKIIRLGGEVRVEFLEPEGGVEEFVRRAVTAEPAASESAAASGDFVAMPTKTKEEIRLARLAYFEKAKETN